MPNDGSLIEIVTYRPAAMDGPNARRHAECVRLLRNAVVDNLTRSNKEITYEDQWAWWTSDAARTRHIAIVDVATVAQPDPIFAGFGMIQPVGVEGWLTGAIHQRYRGKGHGRALFDYLIRQCRFLELEPWLEVYRDNEVAVKLYASLGFQWCDVRNVTGRRILVGKLNRGR